MSCSVGFNRFPAEASGRYPDDFPIVVRSRSCPKIIQRHFTNAFNGHLKLIDSLVFKLAKELISTCKVEFQCMDDGTTSYLGRVVHVNEIKKLVELTGIPVFQSHIYILSDLSTENIHRGKTFLLLTTYDPLPDGFSPKDSCLTASSKAATRSVLSQVNAGSSRPK